MHGQDQMHRFSSFGYFLDDIQSALMIIQATADSLPPFARLAVQRAFA